MNWRQGGDNLRILLFGATGMIGQGVLREALADESIREVIAVGRSAPAAQHVKLHSIVHADLFDLASIAPQFGSIDACLFCLGVSSVGMTKEEYRRITHDLTLSVAHVLNQGPAIPFLYISAAGAGRNSRAAWARVKAQTEDDLSALPSLSVYSFRPGLIVPGPGIRSKTAAYRAVYAALRPLLPFLLRFPKYVTTTGQLGRAMLRVARYGTAKRILESEDINGL